MIKQTLRLKLPRMKGAAVTEFQTLLTQLLYDCGEIDGIYGPKTTNACKAYQKDNLLVVDGICGPKTWASILAKPKQPKDYLQRLIDWGFDESLKSIGEKETIKQFQAAVGISVDGIVGTQTKNALAQPIIVPRFNEEDMKCQCVAAGKNYCNGYPRGHGVGQGILILLERVLREVDISYPNTVYRIRSVKYPTGNNNAGGYRCERWNAERGGAASSYHKKGFAVDVFPANRNAAIRNKIESVAKKVATKGGVGHSNKDIVHIDTRGYSARWKY